MKRRCVTGLEYSMLALIAARPSLDWFTDWAAGPMRFNPAAAASLLLIAGAGLGLTLQPRENRNWLISHPMIRVLGIWLLLLLPWALIAPWLNGPPRSAALREWIRLVSILPVFGLALGLGRQNRASLVLHALLISLIVPALTGIYQLIFQEGSIVQGVHRIRGTFVHPNPFSFYLVLMAGLAYGKLREADRRAGWMILLLLIISLLIATFSFTGAGMFGVAVLVCALGESPRLRRIAIPALLVFALLFVLTPAGQKRLATVTQWDSLDEIERTGKETSSMVWRLLNWRFILRTWSKSPWFGYGLQSAPTVNPNRVDHGQGPGQDPHNDYLRFLLDTGLIGFALFLAWLDFTGRTLWRAARSTVSPPARRLAWTALALYAAWLAGSLNDNLITATAYQYCLWAVFGAALGGAAAVQNGGGTENVS
ncbi:MAG: O-antigen ligase family protein [bacterium]